MVGVAAIGNTDPLSIFGDHALVEYKHKIYDPSYGTPAQLNYTSWEDASVDAHGVQFIKAYSPLQHVLWTGEADPKGTPELDH